MPAYCKACGREAPVLPDGSVRDLSPEQAQAAYDAAPEVPLSDARIQEIVDYATASSGPQTHEEARQFHEGFLSGATAYAAAAGHSTLKRDNEKLREVFDAQGWRTIETFEKLAAMTSTVPNRRNFDDELTCLLNKYSKENGSNTPDFILVDYLNRCLESWNLAVQTREEWYGRTFSPGSLMAPMPITLHADGTIERMDEPGEST